MKGNKLLALIFCLVMILPLVLSACGKKAPDTDDYTEETTTEETETETETTETENWIRDYGFEEPDHPAYEMPYTAEIHDLHGHEFWFLVRENGRGEKLNACEIYAAELTGDKVNDFVYKRNSNLEATYNCSIHEDRVLDPVSASREMLLAGEYQYDYIYTEVSSMRALSRQNLLADISLLKEVDLEKEWWDQDALKGLSVNGKVYYVTGSASLLDELFSYVICFNRDVISSAHLEDPYDLVREGKWTIDKMYEYMMTTGTGFSYVSDSSVNWAHVAACGARISRASSFGEIEIKATVNEDVLWAWAALKPLLTTEHRNVSQSASRFTGGSAAFYACETARLFDLKGKSVNFGVLPMPKLNNEQEEYWTTVSQGNCFAYAIPVTADYATDAEMNGFDSGLEQTAYFLEAFSYNSYGISESSLYDQIAKIPSIKDGNLAEMMEIALKNKVYDPVAIFDFGKIGYSLFSETGSGSGESGSDKNYDTLVSTYESRVTKARKALKEYLG